MTTPSIILYGIPNCDTVKKARTWLTEHCVAHTFHDFKKLGVPADQLPHWIEVVGWEKLINRQGTTWRKVDTVTQNAVVDAARASALMLVNPSVVKRPVVIWADGGVSVGFSSEIFATHLSNLQNPKLQRA